MGEANQVRLSGTITADPELRYTVRGVAVLDVWIGPRRSMSTRVGGTFAKRHGFRVGVHVTAQGKLAEFGAENLRKGRRALIEGRLTLDFRKTSEARIEQDVTIIASKIELDRPSVLPVTRTTVVEMVRPAWRHFKAKVKTMNASHAAAFLNEVVDPFLRAYESHRSSFGGPPAVALWPEKVLR